MSGTTFGTKAGYAFAISQMQGAPVASWEVRLRTAMGRLKRYQKRVLVRLTNDENRELVERAKGAGISVSRLLVQSTLTQEALSEDEKEQLERLLFQREWAINEVARVGNNLNQIARQFNSQRGTISATSIERVITETYRVLLDLQHFLEHGRREE